jgi:hypothetical protein
MIKDTVNRKSHPAVTSDRWHVIHSRWGGERAGDPRFVRSIVSEHGDSADATKSARALVAALAPEMVSRTSETRDQVLVRKPGYKSLKTARRVEKRSK